MAADTPPGRDALLSIPFTGARGRTRRRTAHVGCDCGNVIATDVYASIDVQDTPAALSRYYNETLHAVSCPACGADHQIEQPILFHDPRVPILVLAIPPSQRARELALLAAHLTKLEGEKADIPNYVKHPEVVFSPDQLREALATTPAVLRAGARAEEMRKLDARLSELERREEEVLGREEDLLGREEKLVAAKDKLRERRIALDEERAEVEREREGLRALSLDLTARERALRERTKVRAMPPALPPDVLGAAPSPPPRPKEGADLILAGRPSEEIDRWRASDRETMAICHGGELFLLARPGELLAAFRANPPRLGFQLHQLSGYPLVSLVAQAQPGESEEDAAAPEKPLFWTLDPADDGDRKALTQLGEVFALHLDLYDDESRAVASWDLDGPLAPNVRLALERVDALLAKAKEVGADAKAAQEAFEALSDEERLGRKQHNFSDESFIDLPSPAAARLALGIVSYWSEAENEDYLLLRKSFPVEHWRGIRERVVARALDFGLRLPPALIAFAQRAKLIESPAQALRVALASFAEVSLRLKPSDLEPAHEWENWKLLLADCVAHGVEVESPIEELAAACARKARDASMPVEDETAHGGDLSLLPEDELVGLLDDRAQRRDAALELCERGDRAHAETVFNALRDMTRDEVARVIPSMLPFGRDVVGLFIQGLSHRKSFIRQGCALALGSIRAPAAAQALIEFMLREPTRIWMEAARALGDVGSVAVPQLLDVVERSDGEGRERLAWALAHISLDEAGKASVRETVGNSPTAGSKKLAWRALQMVDYVRQNDQEVRGQRPLSDQTIVRRFTRRFFESMADEVNELDDEDIVEQEEEVGDVDILDAAILDSQDNLRRDALEVDDGDIL